MSHYRYILMSNNEPNYKGQKALKRFQELLKESCPAFLNKNPAPNWRDIGFLKLAIQQLRAVRPGPTSRFFVWREPRGCAAQKSGYRLALHNAGFQQPRTQPQRLRRLVFQDPRERFTIGDLNDILNREPVVHVPQRNQVGGMVDPRPMWGAAQRALANEPVPQVVDAAPGQPELVDNAAHLVALRADFNDALNLNDWGRARVLELQIAEIETQQARPDRVQPVQRQGGPWFVERIIRRRPRAGAQHNLPAPPRAE